MHTLFESIDPEKRLRIINSALEEFASKGGKQATTDNIVAKAGISKGALYKYFGSKEALLIYLCNYVFETMSTMYFANIDTALTDFFELQVQSIELKFELVSKHPAFYDFITRLHVDGTEATDRWLKEKLEYSKQYSANVLNFDYSKFKDDIDIDLAVRIVRLTFDAFTNEVVARLKADINSFDYRQIKKESKAFVTFFKKIYYKEDES